MTMNAWLDELDCSVRRAVNSVFDPCSVGHGFYIGMADMGLLRDVELQADELTHTASVRITMAVTGPCLHTQYFEDAIGAAVQAIDDVDEVTVAWDTSFVWEPESMSPTVQARIRGRREATLSKRRSAVAASALSGDAHRDAEAER